MKVRQDIIRDNNFNIIEESDSHGNCIKYNNNGNIIYYKTNNFEYPSFKSIESPQEQEFINIIKDSVIKIDEKGYPNSITLFKKKRLLINYDLENGYTGFNYDLIWFVFEIKYSMEYEEIKIFLKDMMKKYFNCKGITPFDFWL